MGRKVIRLEGSKAGRQVGRGRQVDRAYIQYGHRILKPYPLAGSSIWVYAILAQTQREGRCDV